MILVPKSMFVWFPKASDEEIGLPGFQKGQQFSHGFSGHSCPTSGNPAPPHCRNRGRKGGASRAASSVRCSRWCNGVQQLLQGHISPYFYGHRMGNYERLLCSTIFDIHQRRRNSSSHIEYYSHSLSLSLDMHTVCIMFPREYVLNICLFVDPTNKDDELSLTYMGCNKHRREYLTCSRCQRLYSPCQEQLPGNIQALPFSNNDRVIISIEQFISSTTHYSYEYQIPQIPCVATPWVFSVQSFGVGRTWFAVFSSGTCLFQQCHAFLQLHSRCQMLPKTTEQRHCVHDFRNQQSSQSTNILKSSVPCKKYLRHVDQIVYPSLTALSQV